MANNRIEHKHTDTSHTTIRQSNADQTKKDVKKLRRATKLTEHRSEMRRRSLAVFASFSFFDRVFRRLFSKHENLNSSVLVMGRGFGHVPNVNTYDDSRRI